MSGNFSNAGSITIENFRIVSELGKLVSSGLIKSKNISFSNSEFKNTLDSKIHTQEQALITWIITLLMLATSIQENYKFYLNLERTAKLWKKRVIRRGKILHLSRFY